MGEKRKPSFEMLLKKDGKRLGKLELFDSELWEDGMRYEFGGKAKRYRLRINGKWNDKKHEKAIKYLTKWQFRDLLWRSIKI